MKKDSTHKCKKEKKEKTDKAHKCKKEKKDGKQKKHNKDRGCEVDEQAELPGQEEPEQEEPEQGGRTRGAGHGRWAEATS